MKKYPQGDIAKVALENERQEGYIRIGKETIDTSRTKNNYHLVPPPDNGYVEFIDQRIKQAGVKRKVKDDAIKMVSFVMTSDKDFFEGMPPQVERAFFSDCVNFVKKCYGEENIISAVAHKDETSPHIHINVVPITPDNRLCAKYYFDGKMSEWQTNVYEEVGKKWGLERGKEGSDAKHVDPKTYNKVVKQATADARTENETLKQANDCLSDQLDEKMKEIEQAKAESEQLTKANAAAQKHFDNTLQEIREVKAERDEIIAERDKEADYFQALKEAKDGNIAHGKRGLKEQVAVLTVENKRLEKENARLVKDNGGLFAELQGQKHTEKKLDISTQAINAIRTHEPEAFARTFFKATSVMQSFIDLFSAPIPLPRNRLREIEQEVERERQEQNKNRPNNNYSSK
ncbi:MAG: plasmid recombination protein [Clostridia bacterium]|nr:plasmid recombination protein [Clostridia bacterium]